MDHNSRDRVFRVLARSARIAGPYVVIWLVVGLEVMSTVTSGQCTGVCAISSGVLAYVLLLGGLILSTIIALAQLLWLARQLRGQVDGRVLNSLSR
jgi:hypothetical protein